MYTADTINEFFRKERTPLEISCAVLGKWKYAYGLLKEKPEEPMPLGFSAVRTCHWCHAYMDQGCKKCPYWQYYGRVCGSGHLSLHWQVREVWVGVEAIKAVIRWQLPTTGLMEDDEMRARLAIGERPVDILINKYRRVKSLLKQGEIVTVHDVTTLCPFCFLYGSCPSCPFGIVFGECREEGNAWHWSRRNAQTQEEKIDAVEFGLSQLYEIRGWVDTLKGARHYRSFLSG